MSGNFYLPEKADSEATYSISATGTKTWTAPDANNDGLPYTITIDIWGAGGGGGSSPIDFHGGGGGGGGAYARLDVTIKPSIVYTFNVGAGGSGGVAVTSGSGNAGVAGGYSGITQGGGFVRAGGGGAGGGGVYGSSGGTAGAGGVFSNTNSPNITLGLHNGSTSGAARGAGVY